MALILQPGQSDYRAIDLAMRDNTPIGNTQDWNPVSEPYKVTAASQRSDYLRKRAGNQVLHFRAGPSTFYNCHGLTFASRRTSITDLQTVVSILKIDNYSEIDKSDILPGDVVIYYEFNGEIQHSGIVIGRSADHFSPQIVSKWGQLNEAIHSAELCPYDGHRRYYRIIDESPTYRPNHVQLS